MAAANQEFSLKVLSPVKKFYEGQAVSLSAVNKAGAFDILAGHVNFFSLLQPGKVVINTGEAMLEIPITSGIVRVSQNDATLFVNI